MPWVVLGELHYGAWRAQRREAQLALIRDFLQIATLCFPDEITSRIYGELKAELARVGRLIPENDIWIAAATRQFQLPIITRDAHFDAVPGLITLSW